MAEHPTKLEVAPGGAALMMMIGRRHGSIRAAARAAGLDEGTVRRLIYSQEPVRAALATVEALERAGYPRAALNIKGGGS